MNTKDFQYNDWTRKTCFTVLRTLPPWWVDLHLNTSKTELMALNTLGEVTITSLSGATLKRVDTFKYIGSHYHLPFKTPISERQGHGMPAISSIAYGNLTMIWISKFSSSELALKVFYSGSDTWTITAKMKQRIDGCYARLLRKALNISWRSHTTNKERYCKIPLLSSTIRQRRMGFVGHCYRAENQQANKLLFWSPSDGKRGVGSSFKTFPPCFKKTLLSSPKMKFRC